MRVLMTGGGTAGHINPALSIAEAIKRDYPDAEFLFVGAEGRMEATLVPQAGYPIRTLKVEGFQRRLSVANIKKNILAAYHAVTASGAAAKIIREFRPDIAIGTGGYVCGPVLRKAAKLGVPVLVHESNALPGVTVKMLAPHAKAVLVSDEAAKKRLPSDVNVVVTGNPLRRDMMTVKRDTARAELGVDERPLVLCFGGSLGARPINEAILGVLKQPEAEQLQFIIGTGRGVNHDHVKKLMAEQGIVADGNRVRIREYIDDMPRCMAAADLVISRCGAMTLSELPALAKPSILVPSPYVAENHQYYNAMALADRGAAVCLEEKDLTAERLWQEIRDIALSPERLTAMSEAASKAAVLDADERIMAVIRDVLK